MEKIGWAILIYALGLTFAGLSPPASRQFGQTLKLEETSETSANASIGDLDRDADLDIVLAKGRHWPLHDRREFRVIRGQSFDINKGLRMWLIQWAKSSSERNEFEIPIRNFGRVNEAIYRGALPDAQGYRTLIDKLGVRRVCSIIEHERLQDKECALDAGIHEWRSIPFSDEDAPPVDRVKQWFDYICTATKQSPIFTHCRGGRHRTGILVGVYRVTVDRWTKEQAFVEMKRYGWYGALGHQPLLHWFLHDFDPSYYPPVNNS